MAVSTDVSKAQSRFQRITKQLLRNRRAVVGGIILLVIITMAIFAPYVATHDPAEHPQPAEASFP